MYWLDSKGTSSLQSSALDQLSVFSVSPSVPIKILEAFSLPVAAWFFRETKEWSWGAGSV